MHIIVLIKQVPEAEDLRYDPATRTLMREGVSSVINPFDKRALTEALRLRELSGGSVTAITMGPPHAREALVECLGRGVERAVHLTDRAFAGSDTLATARVLAAAIRLLPFDLIIAGKWATDAETGQVGPELAELLDLPQVTGATAIEVLNSETLRVKRETDAGFEEVECPLPALLTAAERLIKPVKTTPKVLEEGQSRIAADPLLIETWDAHYLGISAEQTGLAGSPTVVSELRPVDVGRSRLLLSGDAVSSAHSLMIELAARGLAADGAPREVTMSPLPVPVRNPDEARGIWAVAECLTGDGVEAPHLRSVSLELTAEAARVAAGVGGEAVALLIGSHIEPLVAQLASHGASTVLLADSPRLASYDTETYAWVLAEAIARYGPWAVLLPATSYGRDLAPRVAARLGLGLTGDAIGLELDDQGLLLQLKPAFGGQVIAPILSRTLPQMCTLRPGMVGPFAPAASLKANVVSLDLQGLPQPRVRVISATDEGEAGLALDDARLVVCVGTGIGGPEALPQVRRLADALARWMGLAPGEVAIAATRKVVDEGWLPRHQQVGITGRVVAPDLYLGLGVRGNFNHAAGILRSGTIVAVNTDLQAPIFEGADVGIVADWRAFTEALIEMVHVTRMD